jgi:hypothetical protein
MQREEFRESLGVFRFCEKFWEAVAERLADDELGGEQLGMHGA